MRRSPNGLPSRSSERAARGAKAGTSWLHQHLLLLGRFFKNPRIVGAIAPSSQVLARAMVSHLDVSGAVRIVELGPGTGSFTRAVLQRLGPRARFVAIELEPAFVDQVRQQWPTVECVHASAESLAQIARDRGLVPIDHIISGLPFASLPTPMSRRILDGIQETLKPGGTFTTFQYLHAYRLATAGVFRREATAHFGAPPRRRVVWRNVPPAFVLTWTKNK